MTEEKIPVLSETPRSVSVYCMTATFENATTVHGHLVLGGGGGGAYFMGQVT